MCVYTHTHMHTHILLSIKKFFTTESRGMHCNDPHMRGCGVPKCTQVEINTAPWVSNVPAPFTPPWKKSNLVPNKIKAKPSVQSFCFVLKLSPFAVCHRL